MEGQPAYGALFIWILWWKDPENTTYGGRDGWAKERYLFDRIFGDMLQKYVDILL